MWGFWVICIKITFEEFAKMQIPWFHYRLIQKFRMWAKEWAFSVSSPGDFSVHRSMATPEQYERQVTVPPRVGHCTSQCLCVIIVDSTGLLSNISTMNINQATMKLSLSILWFEKQNTFITYMVQHVFPSRIHFKLLEIKIHEVHKNSH